MSPPGPPPLLRPAPGSPAPLPPAQRATEVRTMFSAIVPRYDLMNRFMTAGLDGRWRARAVAAAAPRDGAVLDLGTGTGDMARDLRRAGARRVVAGDFARPMLLAARRKRGLRDHPAMHWTMIDALRLPFADASFDAVTSGFLLRNLVDLPAAFAEMLRVLRPGGRLVALDMTHTPAGARGALVRSGLRYGVAPLAGLLSGHRTAYRYLPDSLDGYPPAEALALLIEGAGAQDVRLRRMGLGTVALHTGHKPAG